MKAARFVDKITMRLALYFRIILIYSVVGANPSWADPHSGNTSTATEEFTDSSSEDQARARFIELCQDGPSRRELESVRQDACFMLRTGKSPAEVAYEKAISKTASLPISDVAEQQNRNRQQKFLTEEQSLSPAKKMERTIAHGLEDFSAAAIVPIIAALRTQFQTGFSDLINKRETCESMARELSPSYRSDLPTLAAWLLKSPRPRDCTFRYRPEDIVATSKKKLSLEEAQALASYGILHPIDDLMIDAILDHEPPQRLTRLQYFLLKNYTDDQKYSVVNQSLRGESTEFSAQDLEPLVTAMNRGLARLELARGVKVTRGISLGDPVALEGFLKEHRPGNIVRYAAFTSTSIDNPYGGNIQLEILSHTGARISQIARYKSENEVLFPAGSCFKVISQTAPDEMNRHLIKLEEVRCPTK